MRTYQVALTRVYLVSIQAEDESRARIFSEYYLGDLPDLSNEIDREGKHFLIDTIEMVYNNADEIVSIEE